MNYEAKIIKNNGKGFKTTVNYIESEAHPSKDAIMAFNVLAQTLDFNDVAAVKLVHVSGAETIIVF